MAFNSLKEGMILKAVGAVQCLKAVTADSDGDLRFAVSDHTEVGNAPR
mgnify:CR=1 FL=1